MKDPFVGDDSDSGGFFVSHDSESLSRGRRLIRDYEQIAASHRYCDDEVDRAYDAMFEAMTDVRVFEIMHNWKHWEADHDQWKLRCLGVDLRVEERLPDREGNAIFECTLRPVRGKPKRIASRSPTSKKRPR